MGIVRTGWILVALAVIAYGQRGVPTGLTPKPVSINESWPLARAAQIFTSTYGIPVSYEDVSEYGYEGDRKDLGAVRADYPDAKHPIPRNGSLDINFAAVPVPPPGRQDSHGPINTAEPASVAKLLQSLIDQHESNGNPGRFKLIETATGFVIVPTATRNRLGDWVPDQSPLDVRISFPMVDATLDVALGAFSQAIKAASGKTVDIPGRVFLFKWSVKIGANNEVARDVLARLLAQMKPNGGLPLTSKRSWYLTTEPGVDEPHSSNYVLDFQTVFLEWPPGSKTSGATVYQQREQ